MDARKDYVAPAVAAEDALEQTSLACTESQKLPGGLTGPEYCEVNIAKGGAYADFDEYCTHEPSQPVLLS